MQLNGPSILELFETSHLITQKRRWCVPYLLILKYHPLTINAIRQMVLERNALCQTIWRRSIMMVVSTRMKKLTSSEIAPEWFIQVRISSASATHIFWHYISWLGYCKHRRDLPAQESGTDGSACLDGIPRSVMDLSYGTLPWNTA